MTRFRMVAGGLAILSAVFGWQVVAKGNLEGEVSQLQADKAQLELVRDWSLNTLNEQAHEINRLLVQQANERRINAQREANHQKNNAQLQDRLNRLRQEKDTDDEYRIWADQPLPDFVYRMQLGTGENGSHPQNGDAESAGARTVHAGNANTSAPRADEWRVAGESGSTGSRAQSLQHRQAQHPGMGE